MSCDALPIIMAAASTAAPARAPISWEIRSILTTAVSAAALVRVSTSWASLAIRPTAKSAVRSGAGLDVLGGLADLADGGVRAAATRCPGSRRRSCLGDLRGGLPDLDVLTADCRGGAGARISISWATLPISDGGRHRRLHWRAFRCPAWLCRLCSRRSRPRRGHALRVPGRTGRTGRLRIPRPRWRDPRSRPPTFSILPLANCSRGIGAGLDLLGHAADPTGEELGRLGGARLDLLGDAADLTGEELARLGGARLDVQGDAADPGGEELGRLGGAEPRSPPRRR